MKNSIKKIIVFGSSGFIGSALVKHLKSLNWEINGCDVVNYDTNHCLSNFFISDDSQEKLNRVFKNDYDVCINCAGSASVPFSLENPFKDYELNTRIVFRILTAIKETNPSCKFINLSSAAVYGNPEKLPITENATTQPISPYGIHKYMGEMICNEFYHFYNIQTCSLRIFSAYGPGLKKQLFWDLYKMVSSSKSVVLFGTGNETRDFIYIDDLVNAIQLVAESDFKYRVINVANGKQETIVSVVNEFIKQYNPNTKYLFNGNEKFGDPKNWEADITILKSLGYTQHISIKEGIKTLLEKIKN